MARDEFGDWVGQADTEDIFLVPPRMTREDEYEAERRRDTIEQYYLKNITREEALAELGVKRSRFRELCRDYRNSANHLGLVKKKRGPKPGSSRTPKEYLPILEASYKAAYRSKRASVAAVKREADVRARGKGLGPLTTHQVRTFILSKPLRDREKRSLGKDEYKQKNEVRVGRRIVTKLNEVWQMDHTEVDILLVDEMDRGRIAGRPWVTMIICPLTRVIVGFYLSMRRPNIDTVAAALIFAVLDKEAELLRYGKKPGIYPACGLPALIYTDNAAEFLSDYLKLRCKRYGIRWEHRPKDKKHYGGAIERVIGTFMTRHVHFLPGATGSNVIDREAFDCEFNAQFDFKQFAKWFFHRVVVYHGTIHRALRCSPRKAWEREAAKHPDAWKRVVGVQHELEFRMTFLPSSSRLHPVTRLGVFFAGRQYMSKELDPFVSNSEKYEVKFNPMAGLSCIWVRVAEQVYIKADCVFVREGLSDDYEAYTDRRDFLRHNPVLPGQTPGAYDWSDQHAFDAHEESRRIEEEVRKSRQASTKSKELPGAPSGDSESNSNSRKVEQTPVIGVLTDAVPVIRSDEYDF